MDVGTSRCRAEHIEYTEFLQFKNIVAISFLLCCLLSKEIEELMQQIYTVTAKVDLTFGLPDLASALKDIQSQYDSIAAKNLQVRRIMESSIQQ